MEELWNAVNKWNMELWRDDPWNLGEHYSCAESEGASTQAEVPVTEEDLARIGYRDYVGGSFSSFAYDGHLLGVSIK